ncbi:MAG: LytTR family transcriptional regulator DNA-binding domain-containing protein [Saprospiraceae bacterium]
MHLNIRYLWVVKLGRKGMNRDRPNTGAFKYEDANLTWIGVPLMSLFVVHLGMEQSLWPLLGTWAYYENILISLLIGYLTFLSIKHLIIRLDKVSPWEAVNTSMRWVKQLIISFLITSFYLFLNDVFDFYVLEERPLFDTTLMALDWPVSLLLVAGVNYYYYTLYQTNFVKQRNIASFEHKDKLLLKTFTGYRQAYVHHIAYAYLVNKITYVVDQQGNKKVVDQTLSSIAEKLQQPADRYFRINRTLIAHRNHINAYHAIAGHRLLVELSPPADFSCIVSKNKAASFKAWFHQNE